MHYYMAVLTVCISLLNNINAIKPAIMMQGTRLITARNFPKRSPKNAHKLLQNNEHTHMYTKITETELY